MRGKTKLVRPFKAVAIGASAGAIEALNVLLPALPPEFPIPIFVVVHLSPESDSMLPDLYRAKCPLKVSEAMDKESIEPGTIYFAPSNYHLLVEKNGYLSLSVDEPVHFSRPSIDVLFESAADSYRESLLGIVLSGANEDGAQGLRTILDRGGQGLVQDPREAHATMMPNSAIKTCPEAHSQKLLGISKVLNSLIQKT